MIFAWQGWQLQMPDEWNPVNLHGTFEAGYALLSDIHRPRLGIRWGTPGRGFDCKRWAREALVAEIGELAAKEGEECGDERFGEAILYLEAEPPGRDVWVGFSKVLGRTFEMVHHVYTGETSKMRKLGKGFSDGAIGCGSKFFHGPHPLPLLFEPEPQSRRPEYRARGKEARGGEMAWAAFDLSCVTGGGWRLASHKMNAGDLSLEFARKSERMSVRQIAVAHLALKRMLLEKWIEEQSRPWMKRYRRVGDVAAVSMATSDGRGLEGVSCRLERRKLMIWGPGMGAMYLAVLHDARRDRLIFVEAKDESQAEELVRSVGWAAQEVLC